MKTIKSALLGAKSLIDTNEEVILVQLREILKQHRELIIQHLLRDIPTYIDYKFSVKPDKAMVESVKGRLLSLKNSNVELDNYKPIIKTVLSNPVTHLTNEPFYNEIDQYLASHVAPKKSTFNFQYSS
jgi:hypothetical protein